MMDPVIHEAVRLAIRVVSQFVRERPKIADGVVHDYERIVERGVAEALEWASRMQIFGMAQHTDPAACSIPLRVSAMPRRFRGAALTTELQEESLLTFAQSIVLLGDPGSGKTTTLKRITKRLILGDTPPDAPSLIPVVVRLRELRTGESLIARVAKSFGLSVSSRREQNVDTSDGQIRETDAWIGNERARDVIGDFLRQNRCILILDGLDEVAAGRSSTIRNEVSWLSLNSGQGHVVVSCRSGDYHGGLEGFRVLEIAPLNSCEIESIVRLSSPAVEEFLRALSATPYSDLADRPLFLVQLVLIHARYGYLPKQPSEVYRLIVLLCLKEWDAERGVVRQSSYSDFNPDRKLSFLAAISYHLTFKIRRRVFDSHDLRRAYAEVCSRFSLPPNQATSVVAEIESHTGLILVAGHVTFEFSHLSLQEYLAAEYISRESHSVHLMDYLKEYPAPVAISVALASDPSLAFASLYLSKSFPEIRISRSFLRRLCIEAPPFDVSPALGVAMLCALSPLTKDSGDVELAVRLLRLPGVVPSVRRAFRMYRETTNPDGLRQSNVRLKRLQSLDRYPRLKSPDSIFVDAQVFKQVELSVDDRPEVIQLDSQYLPHKRRSKAARARGS